MTGLISHVFSQSNHKKIKLTDFASYNLNDEELQKLFAIDYDVPNSKKEFKYSVVEGNDVLLYYSNDSTLEFEQSAFAFEKPCPTEIIDAEGLITGSRPHPFRLRENIVLKRLYLPNLQSVNWSFLDQCYALEDLYIPKLKSFNKHTFPYAYTFRCLPLNSPDKFRAVLNSELRELTIIPSLQKLLDHLPDSESQVTWIS
ncbi:hypothetical protein [Aureivirga marina]|uniref:hypothetical protein n=1 Tax=Aureivirga marina TaxID=1182451 RepID=UPI0018CA3865|nr:hypothetical protein [Aureivirga marina]